MFIHCGLSVFIHRSCGKKSFETRQNCDANEPREDAQGTRQTRRGRLNNETPEQRERRLQIQREPEATEQRQHRLVQQRQRRQD